jgi:hypothetical protein
MLQRTNKLLIGKDISRDAQVVAGATITTIVASTGLADGEIVVLDKNFKVLAAGATVADSDIIYICQGTSVTYDYTNEQGTAVTTNRRILLSDPIQGSLVKSYKGVSYAAKVEQIDDWTVGFTPVTGTEYGIRIVYKDMNEHPGQFTQTYRVTATSAVLHTGLIDLLLAKVNSHSGRRVDMTHDATSIILTGRAIPGCTTGLTDLEEFRMVEFESFLFYIDADGNWSNAFSTAPTLARTAADYGSGTWEQVRDMEKRALPYRGITNFTMFPVLAPAVDTVKSETYDLIVIEHDKSYLSPDNQYIKQAPLTTVIAFGVPGTGTQEVNVLGQLNPWMASLPLAFPNVAV